MVFLFLERIIVIKKCGEEKRIYFIFKGFNYIFGLCVDGGFEERVLRM